MTAAALKAAAAASGKAVATTKKPGTLAEFINQPSMKAQLALALPKHLTADRLVRIATTELRKNPALANCDQASFVGAIMQCAQLGIEPGGSLGHAYLIPYGKTCQFILGYRGMIDLARRSGQIVSIEARTVHARDLFEVEFGLESKLSHKPFLDGDRGAMMYVYAVAKLQGGGYQFEVMGRAEIEKVRAASKAGNSGPWRDNYDEMAKKTVVRRLFKYLPVSIEAVNAARLDEQGESLSGAQDNALLGEVIDHETGEVTSERVASQEAPAAEVVEQKEAQQPADGISQEAKDFFADVE